MAITASAGGGNWSAGGSWVGGVAPTAADDVLLTVASGSITIDGTSGSPNLCRSLDCSTYTGTLTQAAAKVLTVGDGTVGIFKIVAGMTYAPNTTSTINFVSTTGTNNITTAGKAMGPLVFNGAGGSWQFQDGFTNTSCTITLTQGTLDFNGQTLSINSLTDSGTATRALTMGAASITCASTTAGWALTSTGMTFTCNTSTITLSNSGAVFSGGGLTYNNVVVGGTTTVSGANTMAAFTVNAGTGTFATVQFGADQTITTFTSSGASVLKRVIFRSNVLGTPRTLTIATNALTWADFRDITAAGGASWNLSAITGGAGDCGGNTGITFNTPKNCYMKTAASVNWSGSNWYTASGGSTAITPAVPLPQDTAYFDANSITAGSVVVTMNMPNVCGMVWTGVTNSPTFSNGSTNWACYGGIIFVSGMSYTGTSAALTFLGRGSFNVDGGTLAWPAKNVLFDGPVTSLYTITGGFTITNPNVIGSGSGAATLSFGSASVTAGGFSSTGLTVNLGSGTLQLTSTGNIWAPTSCVINAQTSTIYISNTSASTKTFTNQTSDVYNNLHIAGAASNGTVTISNSCTFNTVTIEADASVVWTKSKTFTFSSLVCNGSSGHVVTFATNTGGTAATLSCSNPVDVDYVSIKDSTASGNTPFYAGTHSTSVSGNTNWTFTARPAGQIFMQWLPLYG